MTESETEVYRSTPVWLRFPGCLTGILVGIILMSVVLSWLERILPTLVLCLGGMVLGIGLTRLYALLGERRWGNATPDTVQMLANDLGMFRLRAPDYRVRLPRGAPFSERALHEAVYILKWSGNLLLVSSLAVLMYSIMTALGIVEG